MVMKKILKLLCVMFILYFILQILFRIFGTGYVLNYNISLEDNLVANIKENYTRNVTGEKTNYYFDINVNNQTFSLQTYNSFMFSSKIIKDVKYYNGVYSCIYPIFLMDKQLTDVLCLDNGILKDYSSLKGKDSNLDEFVNNLISQKLYTNNFDDNVNDYYVEDKIKIFSKNLVDNHQLAIDNYRGLYTINGVNSKRIKEVKLFNSDVYERNVSILVNNYYLTPDYNSEYDFNRFNKVNIANNNISFISSNYDISFNSYFQGVVDNKAYLVDKNNKKQYEINLKKNTITEIANENSSAKVYEMGNWVDVSIYDVVNTEKYFTYYQMDLTNPNYSRIDKVGNILSGYYYYYLKDGSNYNVYRANVQNQEQLKYIFTTTDINNITYVDDYVYYYVNNYLKVYQDSIGNKTIYEYKEYEFNKTLNYFVTK